MELTWALRRAMDRYLAKQISLEELQDELDRLAPQLAIMSPESYPARVADHIDITIAEFAQGHRDEDEVRQIVRLFLFEDPTFELSIGPAAKGASGSRTLTPV